MTSYNKAIKSTHSRTTQAKQLSSKHNRRDTGQIKLVIK